MQRGREDAAAASLCTDNECSVAEKKVNTAARHREECSTAERYAAADPPRKKAARPGRMRQRLEPTVIANGGGPHRPRLLRVAMVRTWQPRECNTAEKYTAAEPPRRCIPSKNTRQRIENTVVTNGRGSRPRAPVRVVMVQLYLATLNSCAPA